VDQTKWKSVLVPIEVYREIRERSKREGRTISSELRLIYAESERLRGSYPEVAGAVVSEAFSNG
jgi:hypothetical protein